MAFTYYNELQLSWLSRVVVERYCSHLLNQISKLNTSHCCRTMEAASSTVSGEPSLQEAAAQVVHVKRLAVGLWDYDCDAAGGKAPVTHVPTLYQPPAVPAAMRVPRKKKTRSDSRKSYTVEFKLLAIREAQQSSSELNYVRCKNLCTKYVGKLLDDLGCAVFNRPTYNNSLQKSSANPLSLFIYQLTGYRSFDNHPITARLSKIPLY